VLQGKGAVHTQIRSAAPIAGNTATDITDPNPFRYVASAFKEKNVMLETHYDIFLVIMSYLVAAGGSLCALSLNRDVQLRPAGSRARFLFLAALSLGGVGVWSMHFIGMLAMKVMGHEVGYDWTLTAVSFVVVVAVVYLGLWFMNTGTFNFFKLLAAGVVVGAGVATMHYTGMAAMHIHADVLWSTQIIALSIVIAVVASVAALWLATHVTKLWQMVLSALVMGVAVCGMHYTGMHAAHFMANAALPAVMAPMKSGSHVFSSIILVLDMLVLLIGTAVTMGEINARQMTAYEPNEAALANAA
jgi:NO-binding membrane sensor protein with MHYT domain